MVPEMQFDLWCSKPYVAATEETTSLKKCSFRKKIFKICEQVARPRLARLLHSRLSGLSAINSLYLGRSPSTKQPLIKVILNPFLWQNSHSHTLSLSLSLSNTHTHAKNLSSFLSLFLLIHSASLSLSHSLQRRFLWPRLTVFFFTCCEKNSLRFSSRSLNYG